MRENESQLLSVSRPQNLTSSHWFLSSHSRPRRGQSPSGSSQSTSTLRLPSWDFYSELWLRGDHITSPKLSSTVTLFRRASSLPTDWIGNTNIGLRHAHWEPRRWWWWWWCGHCWDYLLFVLSLVCSLYTLLYLTCNNLPSHSMFSLDHNTFTYLTWSPTLIKLLLLVLSRHIMIIYQRNSSLIFRLWKKKTQRETRQFSSAQCGPLPGGRLWNSYGQMAASVQQD